MVTFAPKGPDGLRDWIETDPGSDSDPSPKPITLPPLYSTFDPKKTPCGPLWPCPARPIAAPARNLHPVDRIAVTVPQQIPPLQIWIFAIRPGKQQKCTYGVVCPSEETKAIFHQFNLSSDHIWRGPAAGVREQVCAVGNQVVARVNEPLTGVSECFHRAP